MTKTEISVILTTYNHLPYLRLFLGSFLKYSMPETELLIHVDGSTDGTVGWLKEQGLDYVYEEHHGMYHGYNEAASRASGEYLALGQEDMVVAPNWDRNLLKYAEKHRLLAIRFVEPGWGSFPPTMDFGKTFDTFDERGFMDYAESISQDKLIPWIGIGTSLFSRELFQEVGCYDENYDPYGIGDSDLWVTIKTRHPEVEFLRCESSIIYHFQSKSRLHFGEEEAKRINERTAAYFREKWGIPLSEMKERLGI